MSLVVRSLRYYWRHHLGYVLSVALACAVLVAGLMVGDSLRAGLQIRTAQRVGPLDHVLALEGRWFGPDFVTRLESETTASLAPLFSVAASAKGDEGRAVGTRLLAVDERMWTMAAQSVELAPGEIILNASLADALGVREGESVIVRFERPDALPSESALRSDEALASLRLTVAAVRAETWPFELDLYSSGERPHNAFISLTEVESRLGWRPLNTVLFDCDCSAESIDSAINRAWQTEDGQIEFVSGPDWIDLRSDRVLLEPRLVEAAQAVDPNAKNIASWFVDKAVGPNGSASYFFVSAGMGGTAPLSRGLGPTDIAVSEALADSLGLAIGDGVKLRLPVLGPRKDVIYREAHFEVVRLYGEGAQAADPSLMPAIPGMVDSESCHEWDVGLPIDLNRITPADEAYWKQNKGAPKAVISMEAAQELWSTSYGTLTAIRFPVDRGVDALSASLRAELSPRDFGFFTQAVRDRMQRSSAPINDFGQLFLGFNLFMILSALFLMSVFAGFAIDRRRSQQGLMVAVGYTAAAVGRSVLAEFGVVTLVGCMVGVVAAVALAQGFIGGLMGVWSDAVGVLELPMWISSTTIITGAVVTWTVSVAAAWLGTRSALAASAWSNLRGGFVASKMQSAQGWPIRWGGWMALSLSLAVALFSSAARGPSAAMVYFGCGALVLLGCLLHVWSWLCRPAVGVPVSLAAVGVASLRVRPKSSLAVVSVLAVGLFMVGGIGGGTLQPACERVISRRFDHVVKHLQRQTLNLGTHDGVAIVEGFQ